MTSFMASLVDLRILDGPLPELSSMFRRLRAYTNNLHIVFLKSFVFVNEGRYLRPAPWSPLAAVKKNDAGRSLGENRWKVYRFSIDILKTCCGKFFAVI